MRTRRTWRTIAAAFLGLSVSAVALVGPGAPPAAAASSLGIGGRLGPDQAITSPDGKLILIMQAGDGNLVLYAPGNSPRWASGTSGNPGAFLTLNSDGNLVVYDRTGTVALWDAFSRGGTPGATHVELQNDGNLVTYTADNAWTWATGTRYFPPSIPAGSWLGSGDSLQSPNGKYTLTMQTDGNLVLFEAETTYANFSPGRVKWHTGTYGNYGAHLLPQASDGNLVIYPAAGPYLKATFTYKPGNVPAGTFQVNDDGNVVFYTAAWAPFWVSSWDTSGFIVYPASPGGPVNPYPASTRSGGWTDRATFIVQAFTAAFPQYSCSGGNDAPGVHDPKGDHYRGNGIDCSHRSGTDDKATGDGAAAWLLANAGNLKIKYVIWWGIQRFPDGTTRPFDGHYDHIHISAL